MPRLREFVVVMALAVASSAVAQDRFALVIGNGKYVGASALKNPPNDAAAVAAALEKLDFRVTRKIDADLASTEQAVIAFRKSLTKKSIALFFYAGHGLQVKGENFLVPVDADAQEESQVKRKCYPVDELLNGYEGSDAALKIVILDSCRDNPLTRSWSRNAGSGLASIAQVPDGTVIAFSTAPGKTALDGRGANSPFTQHLVASFSRRPAEGLELIDALRATGQAVSKEIGQRPWLNFDTSLEDFYLWRGVATASATPEKNSSPPDKSPLTPRDSKFVSIFDGKTLDGWDGNPEFWSVENGVLTGRTTSDKPTKGNTFLIWRKGDVGDFELKLEYKLVGGNSGVQYRSFEVPNEKWVVGGYQIDFDFGGAYSGILYGERFGGILGGVGDRSVIGDSRRPKVVGKLGDSKEIQAAFKKEEWNFCEVTARGYQFKHVINGVTTCEVTDEDISGRRERGILALQLHAGPPMKIMVRNIMLKKLN